MISIREDTLIRNIFDSNKIFFIDFSRYNIFKKIRIKDLQNLIDTHYYVEMFSSRKTNWNIEVRTFRFADSQHYYKYILNCPICKNKIYKIYNGKGICKLNHKIDIDKLVPKFLRISEVGKL